MRYRISHRTAYRYADPAYESFNEVRLHPVSDAAQVCLDFSLNIDPPAAVTAFRDYYGNSVHHFGVPYLHDQLTIEATSEVVTFAAIDQPSTGPAPGEADRSPSLAELSADPAFADEHAEFLIPSAYVGLDAASGEFARALLAADPSVSAYEFFRRTGAVVHDRLQYRLGATTVHSTVAEVLAGGSGVCQDFAHVLISLCRNVGLPARYISGYLGGVEMSTASHAWAEAFIPPYGWVAVDATIGTRCTGRHVIVGIGRDYADVAVLSGTYQGGGQATLDVQVACETLGGSDAMAQLRGGSAPIARLVAIQNLGAMRQFQRGTVMTQAMGGLTQTLPLDSMPPPREQRSAVNDVPTEQPRQQQQTDVSP
jgi:transglutaminase-like putative cysteine protease